MNHAKPRSGWTMLAIVLLALLVREAVAWFSFGSADVGIFKYFSDSIRAHGLSWLYAHEAGFNHPPLPGYWSALAGVIADALDAHAPARWSWFAFIFKQPMIVCDVLVCVLLYEICRRASVAILYAVCPIAILLSAHHGNTDPVYGVLCLVTAYALRERGSTIGAGLALGAAINVKFVPVLLIPVVAALCRKPRQLVRFIAGLTIMSIPFWPLVIWQREALVRNVFGYSSTIDYWGVQQFLMEAARLPRFSAVAQSLAYTYHDRGRWIVLAGIALFILNVRRHRWSHARAYDALACTAAIFLVLAPGFGLQYLAFITPLLFATRPAHGIAFGLAAGLFALFNYWLNFSGGLPIDSIGIATPPRAPGAQFGVLAWCVLVAFAWRTIRTRPLTSDL